MSAGGGGGPGGGCISVVVKPTAGGDKLVLEVEPGLSVGEVKDSLAGKCGIPAPEQRLIYKGQILKDERTIESYGARVRAC